MLTAILFGGAEGEHAEMRDTPQRGPAARVAAPPIIRTWNDLPNRPEAGQAYNRLSRALCALLPGDITASGAALVDDAPTVLALNNANVFAVGVDAVSGERAAIRLRCLPLVRGRISVMLLDDAAGEAPASDLGAHVRDWTFCWDNGEKLSLRSVVKVHDGWSDTAESGERFARAFAAALDCPLPRDPR